ncbi:NAD(P)/FAD-dependent oxidoreductase [Endomicrobium proavitum]|uniref:Uncharacterized protein n=1 Tax=Endomicrobium proavitum TaxID=1408281 RepID=A0A0G3WJV6_9BACT|nr:NAD(P)/FAD-dependent oxidoreductase [Endomicrobium proavitum]AKL97784.1 hypothetical protein Epro_0405 [Endomicrobium proavitum]
MDEIFDVAVIGAGPAGMIAAFCAGSRGLKTVVLEKKARPCIKLSITGKGRCNLTSNASLQEFVSLFRNGKFLYASFQNFSNTDLLNFFDTLGAPCKLERGGRYFPASDKAADIASALIKSVKNIASIKASFDIVEVQKVNDLFEVSSEKEKVISRNVVVATGGLSYPSTGSDGAGYKIAKKFGHTIYPLTAALVPVILENEFLKELKGLKLKNIEASVVAGAGVLAKEFGEAEFTVYGADGPVILTLSSLIAQELQKKQDIFLSLNLKPALTLQQLNARILRELDKFGQYQLQEMLKELLPKQFIKPFSSYCNLQITKKCSQISKIEREKILNALTDFKFKVKGVRDIKEAIVTRGGVVCDEIEQKTMQSKLVKGLYFCGEVLDIDAPTGGFNLQAAFSTGHLAGESVQ